MSYCRWSSDNWKSDVYVYADVSGGFTIHVAGNKVVGEAPRLPAIGAVAPKEWAEAYEVQRKWLETAKHEPIGLPFDGKSFNEPDEEATISRLLELRGLGYHVPENALEGLREEMQAVQPGDSQ